MSMELSGKFVCAFLFALIFSIQSSQAILKSILGTAALADVIPSFYNVRCLSSSNNFTNFLLYSRRHPDDPRPLAPNNWKLLRQSDYDETIPTKVIIHGFVDNIRISDWMMKMKNALLREGDYNVLIVDWSCGNGLPYSQAVSNSKLTAEKLGDLIKFLQETREANPRDFHLIGHSLGSQISAIVGHRIQNLGRISGLDPAGPRFYKAPPELRLDPSDAEFVDVIHTDGGSGLFEGLGLQQQSGHVDFYPNGGRTQPGCHSSPLSILPRVGLARAARYYMTCDHFRAIHFYMESIGASKTLGGSHCQYVGVQCRDWKLFSDGKCADCNEHGKCAPMGYYSDIYPHREGTDQVRQFFVMTSDIEPFCVHQYKVLLEMGPGGFADDGGGGGLRSRQDGSVSYNSIRTGPIQLNIKTSTGKISRLTLNDKGQDMIKPGKKFVYLATSKFPLGEVQEATMWWGTEDKPSSAATNDPQAFGFELRKLEIFPIALQTELRARSLDSEEPVSLCGGEGTIVSRNRFLQLSTTKC